MHLESPKAMTLNSVKRIAMLRLDSKIRAPFHRPIDADIRWRMLANSSDGWPNWVCWSPKRLYYGKTFQIFEMFDVFVDY